MSSPFTISASRPSLALSEERPAMNKIFDQVEQLENNIYTCVYREKYDELPSIFQDLKEGSYWNASLALLTGAINSLSNQTQIIAKSDHAAQLVLAMLPSYKTAYSQVMALKDRTKNLKRILEERPSVERDANLSCLLLEVQDMPLRGQRTMLLSYWFKEFVNAEQFTDQTDYRDISSSFLCEKSKLDSDRIVYKIQMMALNWLTCKELVLPSHIIQKLTPLIPNENLRSSLELRIKMVSSLCSPAESRMYQLESYKVLVQVCTEQEFKFDLDRGDFFAPIDDFMRRPSSTVPTIRARVLCIFLQTLKDYPLPMSAQTISKILCCFIQDPLTKLEAFQMIQAIEHARGKFSKQDIFYERYYASHLILSFGRKSQHDVKQCVAEHPQTGGRVRLVTMSLVNDLALIIIAKAWMKHGVNRSGAQVAVTYQNILQALWNTDL